MAKMSDLDTAISAAADTAMGTPPVGLYKGDGGRVVFVADDGVVFEAKDGTSFTKVTSPDRVREIAREVGSTVKRRGEPSFVEPVEGEIQTEEASGGPSSRMSDMKAGNTFEGLGAMDGSFDALQEPSRALRAYNAFDDVSDTASIAKSTVKPLDVDYPGKATERLGSIAKSTRKQGELDTQAKRPAKMLALREGEPEE